MTDTQFTIIFSSLPATIAAIAALISSMRNSKKVDIVDKKADEIHTMVNSNLTKVQSDLTISTQKIEDLQIVIGRLVEAQKLSGITDTSGTITPAVVVSLPKEEPKEIS